MRLRDLFRKKQPLTSAELLAAGEAVDQQITDARARLDAVLTTFGDRAIEAGNDADLAKIEGELDAIRREVERLAYIKTSVDAKLLAAQQSEEQASLAARWERCAEACSERDEAMKRVQSLAERLAAAIDNADAKGAEVWLAIPEELRSKHWQTATPMWTTNGDAALLEVRRHVAGASELDRASLLDQALQSSKDLLSLRKPAATAA